MSDRSERRNNVNVYQFPGKSDPTGMFDYVGPKIFEVGLLRGDEDDDDHKPQGSEGPTGPEGSEEKGQKGQKGQKQ